MFDAYREHCEFEASRDTEQRNAYRWSATNRRPDDGAKIADLVAAGRWVVVAWSVEYCPATDASLGTRRDYVSDFPTYAEAAAECARLCDAVEFCDGDFGYAVEPRPVPPAPVVPAADVDSDVPF